ncbi:NUDIX domain-containing protein [Kitasatospora sp. NPDC057198]|uniref:NUDIX domain-containing protein n=1 Tax=Kitasatospora sp. NPDC057198 TaxID=3346046 RepID=UPI00362DC8D5
MGWLPPEQYVTTIENATMFGCFFVTDVHGRPLGLRSRRDPDVWQFPGGDVDPGEDPLTTAIREYREETGHDLRTIHPDLAEHPRLLAVTYASAGAAWPRAKAGYVFDGGTLTAQQLDTITLQASEHTEWAVHDLEGWGKLMTGPRHEFVSKVAEARVSGQTLYLGAL